MATAIKVLAMVALWVLAALLPSIGIEMGLSLVYHKVIGLPVGWAVLAALPVALGWVANVNAIMIRDEE